MMARLTTVPLLAATDLPTHDRDVFADALDRLTREAQTTFGPGARLVPVSVSERLHSYVLRLAVLVSSENPQTHLYLKVSKTHQAGGSRPALQERIERDFAATVRVHRSLDGMPEFRTVRPIACYPDLLAIVTEETPGETLLDRLQRDARWYPSRETMVPLESAFASSGRWIRAFQLSEASAQVTTPADMRAYIDHRLQRIEAATGGRGRRLRLRLLRRIDTLGAATPANVPMVAVHADLSPSNIMVSQRHVAVIDFAMARLGHPLQDVARLFTQLDLLATKPYFRPSTVRTLQRSLLAGFDEGLRSDDPGLLLQVLAQRVNHLTSLVTRQYSLAERIYNWVVCLGHWRWLELEAAGRRKTRWD